MIGTIGSGGGLVEMNLTGRPVSVRFQRKLKASELSHGSESPMRALNPFLSESSFLN